MTIPTNYANSAGSGYNFAMSNFKAWRSANHVTETTLIDEPYLMEPYVSFSSKMSTLNPRYPIIYQGNEDTSSCSRYRDDVDEPYLVFKLDNPTYVEYLIATGEAYDGKDFEDYWWSDNTCNTMSNKYFYGTKFYVTTDTTLNSATVYEECPTND